MKFWTFRGFKEEAVMQKVKRYSKTQARRLMQSLQKKRERQTPEHHSPEWVTLYWAERRVLS